MAEIARTMTTDRIPTAFGGRWYPSTIASPPNARTNDRVAGGGRALICCEPSTLGKVLEAMSWSRKRAHNVLLEQVGEDAETREVLDSLTAVAGARAASMHTLKDLLHLLEELRPLAPDDVWRRRSGSPMRPAVATKPATSRRRSSRQHRRTWVPKSQEHEEPPRTLRVTGFACLSLAVSERNTETPFITIVVQAPLPRCSQVAHWSLPQRGGPDRYGTCQLPAVWEPYAGRTRCHHRVMPADDNLADDLTGGAFGMIPLLGPLLEPLGRRLTTAIREEWQRASSKALKAAERVSQMSREDLAEAIAADPRLVPLATRVLFQAGMTGQDETLAALGAVLGNAVRHRDQIDEVEILLGAVAEIRRPHVVVLRVLDSEPPIVRGRNAQPEPGESLEGPIRHWHDSNIPQHVTAMSEHFTRLAVIGLVNAGLVSESLGYGGDNRYLVTDLGGALLDVLATLDDA